MRVKFLTMGMTLALAIALVAELSAVTALSQDNTNQTPPSTSTPQATETPPAKKNVRRRVRRGGARSKRGVPTGVQNCIDRLIELATPDPLVAYDGQPSEIVNNGLMWNDPKSKCSVGADTSLRLKITNLATAWNQKEADKVRSLLQEIKSAAPQ
ncbi:MAG TPA: hypothetical protein VFO63_10850 [Blastocatellia bacterium]|jgi:hypothetical protein|nr:hypothetical protein [Blastocatellia bacterium]